MVALTRRACATDGTNRKQNPVSSALCAVLAQSHLLRRTFCLQNFRSPARPPRGATSAPTSCIRIKPRCLGRPGARPLPADRAGTSAVAEPPARPARFRVADPIGGKHEPHAGRNTDSSANRRRAHRCRIGAVPYVNRAHAPNSTGRTRFSHCAAQCARTARHFARKLCSHQTRTNRTTNLHTYGRNKRAHTQHRRRPRTTTTTTAKKTH